MVGAVYRAAVVIALGLLFALPAGAAARIHAERLPAHHHHARGFSMPLPPRFPQIVYGPCPTSPEAEGCAATEPTAQCPGGSCVWLASGERFTKVHELGHIFDAQVLDARDRARFTRLLGFRAGTPWLDSDDPTMNMPGEVFADAYALCGMRVVPWLRPDRHGVLRGHWIDAHGWDPSDRDYRTTCAAIRFVGLGV